METPQFLAKIIAQLIAGREDIIAEILFVAFCLAVVSHYITEKMMLIFWDKDTVEKWKPLGFFLVNLFMLTATSSLFGSYPLDQTRSISNDIAMAIFISAISAAIYYAFPQVVAYLKKYNLKRINGNNKGVNNGISK